VKRRTILGLVIAALFIIGISYLTAIKVNLMPQAASSRAILVDQLTQFMTGIAAAVFLIVEGGLIYAVIRFRRRQGDGEDATPVHGNNWLEVIWTIIPAIIVVIISIYSFQVLTEIEKPGEGELIVEVTGRQFIWDFRYPQYGVSSQELHLKLNQPVRFEISSADVIHSFWIPEFRAKQDATPGQISEMVITPIALGTFPIRCAELCGAAHSAMNSTVTVESEADFDEWIASLSTDAEAAADEPAGAEIVAGNDQASTVEAADIFLRYGCGACHALEALATVGTIGPGLDNLAEVAAERVSGLGPEAYLKQALLEPNTHIVDGYNEGLMPADFSERMSPLEIETLVTYLLNQ
jgi:cytochrome c oxidase subunit II